MNKLALVLVVVLICGYCANAQINGAGLIGLGLGAAALGGAFGGGFGGGLGGFGGGLGGFGGAPVIGGINPVVGGGYPYGQTIVHRRTYYH